MSSLYPWVKIAMEISVNRELFQLTGSLTNHCTDLVDGAVCYDDHSRRVVGDREVSQKFSKYNILDKIIYNRRLKDILPSIGKP